MKWPKTFFLLLIPVSMVLVSGRALVEAEKANGQTRGKPGASYGRDPFRFPGGNRSPAKEEAKKEAPPFKHEKEAAVEVNSADVPPPTLNLRAILIGDRVRLASIDRRIVTVGDMIREEKVLEIKSDQVVLGKGDRRRSLYLSQSPIRLSVEER
jgi:hypothetical protein